MNFLVYERPARDSCVLKKKLFKLFTIFPIAHHVFPLLYICRFKKVIKKIFKFTFNHRRQEKKKNNQLLLHNTYTRYPSFKLFNEKLLKKKNHETTKNVILKFTTKKRKSFGKEKNWKYVMWKSLKKPKREN